MSNKNTPKNEWEHQYEREYNRIKQAIYRQKKLGYFVPEEIIPLPPSKVKNITQEHVERLTELTPQNIRKRSIYIDTKTGESVTGLDILNSHHVVKSSEAKITESYAPKVEPPSQLKPVNVKTPTKSKQTKKTKKPKSKGFTPPESSTPPKENNFNLSIIDRVNEMLSDWYPEIWWKEAFLVRKTQNYTKIQLAWEDLLDSEGEYEVAYRLEQNAQKIIELIDKLIHESDSKEEDDFNMGWLLQLLLGRALTAEESDWYSETSTSIALDSLRGENSLG